MDENTPYWLLDPFLGEEGSEAGFKPSESDYGGYSPPGYSPGWNPTFGCEEAGGYFVGNECVYPWDDDYIGDFLTPEPPEPPELAQEIYSPFDCTPGTMYRDAQGFTRWCPSTQDDTGYATGISTETAWAEQENPLLSILSQNPEFLQNYDISKVIGMFRDLGTAEFDIERKGYLETLGGFRQEKEAERKKIGSILKGSAIESGEELAASGFGGGGAYGREAGKLRQKTVRDYRQAMEDINLSMTESDIGFEEAIGNIRYDYGEEVSDIMASLYNLSPTLELTADVACGEGEVWMGEETGCVNIEEEGGLEAILYGV
jgi:hypothetical protein